MSLGTFSSPPTRLVIDVDGGRLQLDWYGEGALPEGLLEAGLARRGQRDGGSRVVCSGVEAWVKGGRLTAKSALRHLVRRQVLARPFPRLAEARNLAWLRAQGIAAARPLLSGLFGPKGRLPTAQFLATEYVPGAVSLDVLQASDPVRHELGRTAARQLLDSMHAAGFSHRDAYARNFLITDSNAAIAIDTWRGGPKHRLSGAAIARDLADFEESL